MHSHAELHSACGPQVGHPCTYMKFRRTTESRFSGCISRRCLVRFILGQKAEKHLLKTWHILILRSSEWYNVLAAVL